MRARVSIRNKCRARMMKINEMPLDDLIESFIKFKQVTGRLYNTEEYYLKQFKLLCNKRGCLNSPGKAEFMEWMVRRPEELPQTQHTRLSPIRQLYSYMCDIGIEITFKLPKSIRKSSERYRLHFIREDEISLFFSVCDTLQVRKENPCREVILPAAFRLVYCCGLRPIEVIKLKTVDVHLENGYIDIIGSKNHKDRRLFLSSDLIGYLHTYVQKVRTVWLSHIYFFPNGSEHRYARDYLRLNFHKIWEASVGSISDSHVRLYDLRHHFAFANINRWAREGKDVNSMIAYLSRYMGHASIESTYYYIHLVPEYFSDYANTVKKLSDLLPEVDYED